ncbi:MAG: hypothetical protein ACREMJ_09425, partial [Gemmatimonadales bacterium]
MRDVSSSFMEDFGLRLLRLASDARDVHAYWQAAAEAVREATGARAVTIEYHGLSEQGTVTSGQGAPLAIPEAVSWSDAEGRRAELRLSAAPAGAGR